jgi:hypothetical protein
MLPQQMSVTLSNHVSSTVARDPAHHVAPAVVRDPAHHDDPTLLSVTLLHPKGVRDHAPRVDPTLSSVTLSSHVSSTVVRDPAHHVAPAVVRDEELTAGLEGVVEVLVESSLVFNVHNGVPAEKNKLIRHVHGDIYSNDDIFAQRRQFKNPLKDSAGFACLLCPKL